MLNNTHQADPVEGATDDVSDLAVGQVQWHCSEEDGGPDVGILLRLSKDKHLWLGELLEAEVGGSGIVIYGPKAARQTFQLEYDELRQVFEEHVGPAIATLETRLAHMTEAAGGMAAKLGALEQAEAAYRYAHDILGAGDSKTGRAWDLLRRAGSDARTALTAWSKANG